MPDNIAVSSFSSFHELDPSKQNRCIYLARNGSRCKWPCTETDNERAIELHKIITASSNKAVDHDILVEYILCSCCAAGSARHRDRIVDAELLLPLAERWREEIKGRITGQSNYTAPTQTAGEGVASYDTLATTAKSAATHSIVVSDLSDQQETSSKIAIPGDTIANSFSYEHDPPTASSTTEPPRLTVDQEHSGIPLISPGNSRFLV